MIFNVPEHTHRQGEDNKRADIEDIMELSSALGLDNLQISSCFRLGAKKVTVIRPLKLVLEMKSKRKFLLDNAKFVEKKAPANLKRVIIVKDLTPTQRAERKKRNQAKNAEREESTRELDRNQAPMEVGAAVLPSPIPAVDRNKLSQLNIHADADSEVFNETTIIGAGTNGFQDSTHIGDETAIGGYNRDSREASPAPSAIT